MCMCVMIIDDCVVFSQWTDEVKTTEEPVTEADLLKVEVVDEVKASEAEEHDAKADEKGDAVADDEEHIKNDEEGGELSVDVDKDSE